MFILQLANHIILYKTWTGQIRSVWVVLSCFRSQFLAFVLDSYLNLLQPADYALLLNDFSLQLRHFILVLFEFLLEFLWLLGKFLLQFGLHLIHHLSPFSNGFLHFLFKLSQWPQLFHQSFICFLQLFYFLPILLADLLGKNLLLQIQLIHQVASCSFLLGPRFFHSLILIRVHLFFLLKNFYATLRFLNLNLQAGYLILSLCQTYNELMFLIFYFFHLL